MDGTTEVGTAESAPGPATNAPRVVVSFSTTSLPGMRRAYRNAIEALRELPVEAIVTTGGFDLGNPRRRRRTCRSTDTCRTPRCFREPRS